MVIGIGTDLMNISHLTALTPDDVFFRKTFTERELENFRTREEPYRYLAERFAVKEAVFKAFGISGNYARLNEIETLNDENGVPFVNLSGKFGKLAAERGVSQVFISLSSDGGQVLAFVVLSAKDCCNK